MPAAVHSSEMKYPCDEQDLSPGGSCVRAAESPGGGSRVGPNTSAEKGHVGSNATIAMLAARACSGAPPLAAAAAAHQWRVGRLLFKIFVSSAALLLLAHVSLDLIGIRVGRPAALHTHTLSLSLAFLVNVKEKASRERG